MHLAYFNQMPYKAYPREEAERLGYACLLFPNRLMEPAVAARLYAEYIELAQCAETVGFDGVMLNEHHNAVFNMQPRPNILAAALSQATSRLKLVLLGNALPLAGNPVRVAEELAMVDLLSGGRLVSGVVRAGGQENIAYNANPAFNRERFYEAHDLIVKTWTEPGPFRWEGTHYHQRVVNPWALPLQQPHPRIWAPGLTTKETIEWAASHGYPYISLDARVETGRQIWAAYETFAREAGFAPGPEHRGYLVRVQCQDTAEKAERCAREYAWMPAEIQGAGHPIWAAPSGYQAPGARKALALARAGRRPMMAPSTFEEQSASGLIIHGTPDQCVEKLRRLLVETRPGILVLWAGDGRMTYEDTQRGIELLGNEVAPALREIAAEHELVDPFEIDSPVSISYMDRPLGRAAVG